MRASVVLRPFLSELGMFSVPSYVCIPEVGDTIGEDGTVNSDKFVGKLDRLVREVGWYAEAVLKQKETCLPPQ